MSKIISVKQAIDISKKLRYQQKNIVLVGGCFDILHAGHVAFFENAKKHGDVLFVLLESDETIKKIKGESRPFYKQKDRAYVLSALSVIDYVISLPEMTNDYDYDKLLLKLKPTIIATTKNDPNRKHKERQAALAKSKVLDVIQRLPEKSTSSLAKILNRENDY